MLLRKRASEKWLLVYVLFVTDASEKYEEALTIGGIDFTCLRRVPYRQILKTDNEIPSRFEVGIMALGILSGLLAAQ